MYSLTYADASSCGGFEALTECGAQFDEDLLQLSGDDVPPADLSPYGSVNMAGCSEVEQGSGESQRCADSVFRSIRSWETIKQGYIS